jgi:hypothetical protein
MEPTLITQYDSCMRLHSDWMVEINDDKFEWTSHLNHYGKVLKMTKNGNFLKDGEMEFLARNVKGFESEIDDHHDKIWRYFPDPKLIK